ncbi:hypothetical protein HRI_001842700 [Hibiscus trionum]|nr:hypothetical protein HRI_001842700 [Hibiscus trionum]
MYVSPILICTAVSIRFYWKTKHPEVQTVKKQDSVEKPSPHVTRSNEEKPSPHVNRLKVPLLRHQKSVRRNARMELQEWDRDDSPHMNLFSSRSICDVLPGKSSLSEANSKLVIDANGSSDMELGESSSQDKTRNDQAPNDTNSLFDNETSKPRSMSGDSFRLPSGKIPDDGVVDVERLEERKNAEDKEVQEDRNKGVEWTKEDEKNLMDLGLTESERNERLESLISKRRARKMFKMAIEKTLMDKGIAPHSQIAPILIVKNNILGASNSANDEGLQMPGSAPSILLPKQNLFDLPYDPFEEKPNLSADSSLKEFMPANQKEMLFCRHESFCHGPLFTFDTSPDPNNQFNPYYGAEKRLAGDPAVDRFRRSPDDEGGPLRHNSIGFGSEIDLIEVQELNHNEAMNSPEEKTEKIRESVNDKTEIEENNENPRDLSGSEVRMDIVSTKNNDSCHSPSSSDDSESGLDQTTRPLSLCANQVRKALYLSIPPKWRRAMSKPPYDSSPSPSRTEFNLFNNTDRQQDHTRNCSLASDLQVEVSEVGSATLSTDGTVSPVEGEVTYDGDVGRDINSDGEGLWRGSFNLTKEANREKLRELDDIIEEDSVEVKLSVLNKKPEEPIASISPSEQEAVQILNNESSLSSRLDTTEDCDSYPANINRETHEDVIRSGGENVSDKLSPEDLGKTVQLTENSVAHSPPEPCFQKPEQLIDPQQKPTEELNIICNAKVMTRGDVITLESKSSETRDDGAQGFIEPAALGEMRKPDEAINLDSCKYKHGDMETSYDSKRTMDSEKKMEESQASKYIEEDTHNLTKHDTVDSPNAVQSRGQPSKNIGEDTRNLTEYHNGGAPNAVMEDIERYNSARNQPHENSTFNMLQISQQLVENSVDHSSSNCNSGTSEGSSDTTKKTPDGSTVHDMNELVLEGTHGKEDSSINSSKDESKTSTSPKDAKELSKSSGESNPDSNEHLGGLKSDDPKTTVTEKSAAEVDRNCNVNESLTNKSSTHVLDHGGEPHISDMQKAIMEPSMTSGATSAGSVKDTEHESRTLAEADANAGLSTSRGESNSLKDIINSGDVQNSSSQESLSGALGKKEDNLEAIGESISGVDNTATGMSVDHAIAMEASKLKESEVEAVNTKENDGDEVAK